MRLNERVCDPENITHASPFVLHMIDFYSDTVNVWSTGIENIWSMLIVLFWGPWTDKHGRKLLMILPMIGEILSNLIFIWCYYTSTWPAEFLLLANIPVGLFGSEITIAYILCR